MYLTESPRALNRAPAHLLGEEIMDNTTPTLYWQCTASADWKWYSGEPNQQTYPAEAPAPLFGMIQPPTNWKEFEYTCASLQYSDGTMGYAYFRYYWNHVDGGYLIQAITMAQGSWVEQGTPGTNASQTEATGGINLLVQLTPIQGTE